MLVFKLFMELSYSPAKCGQAVWLLHYVLPFPVGKKYVLSQTCCNPAGGHRNQLGYDFAIYLGDTVYCMRSGIVKEIREDQPDNGGDITARNHNYIMI